jgi:hypothetical protein
MTCIAVTRVHAAESDELDNTKWKIDGNAWISTPTGNFRGENGNGSFNLQRDFGFGNYVTFSGNADWRFKRKHHILVSVQPVISSRTTTIARTITWEGETYDLGAMVKADIQSLIFSPGYQYDIFRRRRWSLGIQANANLIYTQASLRLAGSLSQGGGSTSNSSERTGTFFAALPTIGPVGHVYPLRSWEHFHIDGDLRGCLSSDTEITIQPTGWEHSPSPATGMCALAICWGAASRSPVQAIKSEFSSRRRDRTSEWSTTGEYDSRAKHRDSTHLITRGSWFRRRWANKKQVRLSLSV